MARPLALDLFSGAGGATAGLQRVGFEVVGVDIKKQPRYCGDHFIQADACAPPLDISRFDFIWASPPCQAHTALKTMHNAKKHDDFVPATRKLLIESGKPYCIENVPGAPLRADLILCGTMFGLGTGGAELWRHRLFETNLPLILVPCCNHYARGGGVIGVYGGHGRDRRRTKARVVGVYGGSGGSSGSSVRRGIQQFSVEERAEAMGIDWMTGAELSQAIPPAYSEYIGREAMRFINAQWASRTAPARL